MAELTPLCPLLEPGSRETDLARGAGADRAFACPGSRDSFHCPHWFDSIGAACHWCGAGVSRTAARETHSPNRPVAERAPCADLEGFHDRTLGDVREAAFAAHLPDCERCREGLIGLMQLEELGQQYLADRAKAKAELPTVQELVHAPFRGAHWGVDWSEWLLGFRLFWPGPRFRWRAVDGADLHLGPLRVSLRWERERTRG